MIYRILFPLFVLLSGIEAACQDFGYMPNPTATKAFVETIPPVYAEEVGKLVAKDNDADALLYRALVPCLEKHGLTHWLKERNGKKVARAYNQNPVGSCVGNATAAALSILNAVEVHFLKEPQEFVAMHNADATYGLCRESAGMLGNPRDGCYGSAAAKSITNIGTLYQLVYGDVDLTKNIPSRAREFGYRGVGEALKTEAAKHRAFSATQVRTAQDAWSLIGNGYPINVCSGQGFVDKRRDAEGICQPNGSWSHSMAVIGRRTTADGRKLFLIWNSWGDDWCSGPYMLRTKRFTKASTKNTKQKLGRFCNRRWRRPRKSLSAS